MAMNWPLRHGLLDFSQGPLVMGILNVTPDSFSDAGEALEPDRALRRARELVTQGADIVDIGPESTRPGALPVPREEQIRRIDPVLRCVRGEFPDLPISVDTRDAGVAAAAIELGTDIVNDVSALRGDSAMIKLLVHTKTPAILMHMKGVPETMQANPEKSDYDDVVAEVIGFLLGRIDFAVRHGMQADALAVDPGIGFGKRLEHNLAILARLDEFAELGAPVVVGVSRKSFIGAIDGESEPRRRRAGTLACEAIAAFQGAHVIRTHDVGQATRALRLAHAVRAAKPS